MQFFRIYPDTIAPMKAEKSALGNLPTAAFQYCEPIRTASAYGWLVFPPTDIRLRFDGSETLIWDDETGRWSQLGYRYFEESFWQRWEESVPPAFQPMRIPFLSPTFASGVIQIWSGLLVKTDPDVCTHVRPIANVFGNSSFHVYEGIVDTDVHQPWPLFGNLKLVATDRDILLHRTVPLFQVQPVHRQSLQTAEGHGSVVDVLDSSAEGEASSVFDTAHWSGLATTVRDADVTQARRTGDYAAKSRRRSKE